MVKKSNNIALLLLVVAILCVIFDNKISQIKNFKKLSNKQVVQQEIQSQKTSTYEPKPVKVVVNRPIYLTGKTKDEVYKIRKKYVESSIFKNQNYQPSEEVFGLIQDRKPWISINVCHAPKAPLRTDGLSEESRFINNPSILIGIEFPFSFSNYTDDSFCETDETNIIPQSVFYDGEKKLITVVYKSLPFKTNDYSFYSFNGINATDFGYKYIYLDRSKSTYNIKFSQENNISNSVYELSNYIHLGTSCGVDGGCNNSSPRQTFVEFKHNQYNEESGKYVYIKLWKEKPLDLMQKPDLTEKIIFL